MENGFCFEDNGRMKNGEKEKLDLNMKTNKSWKKEVQGFQTVPFMMEIRVSV